MAFYASRCVSCPNPCKHCVEQAMTDSAGHSFSLQMYECGEAACEINQKRHHGEKELQRFTATKKSLYKNERIASK